MTAAEQPGRIDPSERLRLPDGAGGTLLPGDPDPTARAARVGTRLFPGDRIESGASPLTLRDARGREVVLGPDARAVIPPFGGSDVILTRGVATVGLPTDPRAAFVIDTPAVRARVGSGSVRCLVTDDGRSLCAALAAPVEIWPSPPAPASLLGARTDRRPRGHRGHPVSLDVAIREVDASARVLRAAALAPGRFVLLSPDGAPSSDRPASLGEAALRYWRARIERPLARSEGHLYPIAQLARAATGDLADARALLAGAVLVPDPGLRAPPAPAPPADDPTLRAFRLSAALGRAVARADRARVLALRGGDVTALVPVARLDDLAEAARVLVPPAASMLDSDERPHVR